MTRAKLVASVVVSVGFVAVLIWDQLTRTRIREELRSVRSHMQLLTEEIAALQQQHQPAARLPLSTTGNTHDAAQFAALRAAIAQLRESLGRLESGTAAVSNDLALAMGRHIPFVYQDSTKREEYIFAGYSTVESALQSALWAITQTDGRELQNSLTAQNAAGFAQMFQELPEGVMPIGFRNGEMFKASGYRILQQTPLSDDEVRLRVFLEGSRVVIDPIFKKVGNEWKWARN